MSVECGLTGYGRMLMALRWSPETHEEIAVRNARALARTRNTVRCMLDMRLIHICGWKKDDPSIPGRWKAVFREGDRPDAPPPLNNVGLPCQGRPKGRIKLRPTLIAFAALWRAMATPHTVDELAAITGLHPGAIRRFVNHASAAPKRYVRVAEWKRTGTYGIAARYALGPQANVERPVAPTRAEHSRRRRVADRLRAEQEQATQARNAARAAHMRALASNASIFRLAQGA